MSRNLFSLLASVALLALAANANAELVNFNITTVDADNWTVAGISTLTPTYAQLAELNFAAVGAKDVDDPSAVWGNKSGRWISTNPVRDGGGGGNFAFSYNALFTPAVSGLASIDLSGWYSVDNYFGALLLVGSDNSLTTVAGYLGNSHDKKYEISGGVSDVAISEGVNYNFVVLLNDGDGWMGLNADITAAFNITPTAGGGGEGGGEGTATPEPATLALFGLGLGGLALARRRRK